jgi:hypothetical protein
LQLGANANLVLVAITGVYVFLTYRILKWSTLQAREALQPKLDISTSNVAGVPTSKTYRIQNVGQYSVIVLDVRLSVSQRGIGRLDIDRLATEVLGSIENGVQRDIMGKGLITIRNGEVVGVQSHKEGMGVTLIPGEALDEVLTKLRKAGWKPEGEVPPYTSQGEYTIPIVKCGGEPIR